MTATKKLAGDWGAPPPRQSEGNDWGDRFDAFDEGAEMGSTPSLWTPEHVQARMVEAFGTLARSGGRVGPKAPGAAWPAVLMEFSDMIDEDARAEAERQWRAARNAPSASELSRMVEVLNWPLRYLRGDPLQADALVLFGLGRGEDLNIREIIRARKATAQKRIDDLDRSWAFQRRCLAQRLQAEVAPKLKKASHDRAERIKEKARAQMIEECTRLGILPRNLKPIDVMPGKVLSRSNLDKQRRRATAAIAAALNAASVPVF